MVRSPGVDPEGAVAAEPWGAEGGREHVSFTVLVARRRGGMEVEPAWEELG